MRLFTVRASPAAPTADPIPNRRATRIVRRRRETTARSVDHTAARFAPEPGAALVLGNELVGVDTEVLAACDGLVACVPKKWRNVQSVVLKLPDSASLPVFAGELEPIKRKAPEDEPPKKKKARVAEPVVKKPGRKSLKAKLREMK